jgi:hypothetical protein
MPMMAAKITAGVCAAALAIILTGKQKPDAVNAGDHILPDNHPESAHCTTPD